MKPPVLPKWQLIAVPTVVIALSMIYFARYFVADELIEANSRVQVLEMQLEAVEAQHTAEKERLAIADHEVDIVRRANELLRVSERERQDEIAQLQADLAFYRRLGGANGSQAALAVHHVELQATQSPRVYRILFTLTQNLRWAAVISGRIQLGLDGISDGSAVHLTDAQLLADSAEALTFKFKYFQQLERLITLPEDFQAKRLTVHLKSGSLRTPVEQSMEWSTLFDQSNAEAMENEMSRDSVDD
jgi:hypothetical protein